MKSIKKAPAYEQAKTVLDSHIAKTGEVLTIRKLKAACGGAGSNETYQQYLARWRAERGQASGVIASLLALKSQIAASAALANSLVDQALLQLSLSGLNSGGLEDKEDIGDYDLEDDSSDEGAVADPAKGKESTAINWSAVVDAFHGDDDMMFSSLQADIETLEQDPVWRAGVGTRSANEIEVPAKRFEGESEELPLKGDDVPAVVDGGGGELDGLASPSASIPNAHSDSSLSRLGGGGPQTAYSPQPNQPVKGESDTSEGRRTAKPEADQNSGCQIGDGSAATAHDQLRDDRPSASEPDRPAGGQSELPLASNGSNPEGEER